MKRFILAGFISSVIIAGVVGALAQANVTVHAALSERQGEAVKFTNFDVTLDGRLLRADEAIYNTDTGDTELRGNVHVVLPPHLVNKMTPETQR